MEKEANEIADAVSKPISVFAKRIKGKAPYVYEMKKTENMGSCVFLQNNLCLIYQTRPLVCRFYPFELRSENNQEYEFSSTKECPGINKGRVLKTQYYDQLFRIAKTRIGVREKRQKTAH